MDNSVDTDKLQEALRMVGGQLAEAKLRRWPKSTFVRVVPAGVEFAPHEGLLLENLQIAKEASDFVNELRKNFDKSIKKLPDSLRPVWDATGIEDKLSEFENIIRSEAMEIYAVGKLGRNIEADKKRVAEYMAKLFFVAHGELPKATRTSNTTKASDFVQAVRLAFSALGLPMHGAEEYPVCAVKNLKNNGFEDRARALFEESPRRSLLTGKQVKAIPLPKNRLKDY